MHTDEFLSTARTQVARIEQEKAALSAGMVKGLPSSIDSRPPNGFKDAIIAVHHMLLQNRVP
jgi:hypothetical protein